MEENKSTVSTGELQVIDKLIPNCTVKFHKDTKVIGTLDFNGDKLEFTGDATESANVFMEFVAQSFHGRLLEERKKQIEIDAGICSRFGDREMHPYECEAAIRNQEVK